MLLAALSLAFDQAGRHPRAWKETGSGLVLYSNNDNGTNPFPESADGLSAAECLPFVAGWLNSEFAKTLPCEGLDSDLDHDGHNGIGWRVYCGKWGHVDGDLYSMCAVKRVFLWYGK